MAETRHVDRVRVPRRPAAARRAGLDAARPGAPGRWDGTAKRNGANRANPVRAALSGMPA